MPVYFSAGKFTWEDEMIDSRVLSLKQLSDGSILKEDLFLNNSKFHIWIVSLWVATIVMLNEKIEIRVHKSMKY